MIQSNIEGGKNVWKVEFPPLGDGRFAHKGADYPVAGRFLYNPLARDF